MFAEGSFNSSVLRGLAAACDHPLRPLRMLRSPRREEEVEEEEGEEQEVVEGYIYLSLLHRSKGWSTASPSDLSGETRDWFEERREKTLERDLHCRKTSNSI